MTEATVQPSSPPDDILDALRASLGGNETPLGEELMPLGALNAPLGGPCLVTLDSEGAVVLITVLSPVTRARAARFGEESDRVRSISPDELRRSTDAPADLDPLAERHAAYFGLPAPVNLNRSRRLMPIVQHEMDGRSWDILADELGSELDAVYLHDGTALRRLPLPDAGPPPPPPRSRTTPVSTLVGIAALVLGVGLILLAIAIALRSPP